jgi:hypothetical protein
MRKTTLALIVCLVIAVLAGWMMAAQPAPKSANPKPKLAGATPLPPITISPNAPYVVPTTSAKTPKASQPMFNWFSWETFVALNWPAAIDSSTGLPIRGQPNTASHIGDPGPRVWETYKADWETFGTGSQSPQPTPWSSWQVTGGMSPCTSNTSPGKKLIVMLTKMDSILPGFNEANAGPLIDQNQNYVRYEIRLNQSEYQSILTNQWYLQANLPITGLQFTASTQGTYGALEVKAAWRQLVKGKDDFTRYYSVPATVVNPGNPQTCVDTTLGLIGLHIAAKTFPFTEWVWATFEHEDNVPGDTVTPSTHYSLNNGSATPDSSLNGFNYPPNGAAAQTQGPAPLQSNQPLPTNPTPVQVTRFITTIDPSIVAMNKEFHAQLGGTVWVHYKLVADQWPSITTPGTFNPSPSSYPAGSGTPFPATNVANTAAETYFQNAPAPGNLGNSCMQCHFVGASYTDFSWAVNLEAYPPVTSGTAAALRAKPMSAAAKHRLDGWTRLRAAMRARFAPASPAKPSTKRKE